MSERITDDIEFLKRYQSSAFISVEHREMFSKIAGEIADLRRTLEIAERAMRDEIARGHREMYERCMDCDYPQECNNVSGCKCVPNPRPQLKDALDEIRKVK